MLMFCLKD